MKNALKFPFALVCIALAGCETTKPIDPSGGDALGTPSAPYLTSFKPGVTWQLVENMSDEFDGTVLDTSKWQAEPRANGWNWIGRAPGLFKAENVAVKDGNMQVTVSKLDEPVTIGNKTFKYQGAIVRSNFPGEPGMFFECKMKANATEMSSTFWLMTKGNTVKMLELDIQECVGVVTEEAEPWASNWDQIFHSNMIHRKNKYNPEKLQLQGWLDLEVKNSSRYFVYGAWWKSEREVQFFLDGEYAYTINPEVDWDVPAYLQMAIETYSWNPVPDEGSRIEHGTLEERMTQYEWIRTWRVVD